MDELLGLLSRERRLLEVLLFKLVEARHLLAGNEIRFLPWAAAEVERAVARARESELLRAALVAELARALEVGEERLTLRALADESAEPYAMIFADHHRAFLELVAEIEEVSQTNRRLAGRGMNEVQSVLAMISERETGHAEARTYGPGNVERRIATAAPMKFDTAL